jgi:multidomain signaling protein FimX
LSPGKVDSHQTLHKHLQVVERQLQVVERQLLALLNNTPVATALLRKDTHIYCNEAYASLLGIADRKSLLGKSVHDLVHTHEPSLCDVLNSNCSGRKAFTIQAGRADKSAMLSMTFSHSVFRGQDCLKLEAIPASGNAHHRSTKQLRNSQDLLTKLENSDFFTARIESAISRALQSSVVSILLVVRIDKFRNLQETLGRSGSNRVLEDISGFLKTAINKSFAASRLAENEFALLLYNTSMQEGHVLKEYLESRLAGAFSTCNTKAMPLHLSTGMAVINTKALDAEDMINRARLNSDLASAPNNEAAKFDVLEETDFDRFRLVYQPLISLHVDNRARYEVLLRYEDSNSQLLLPNTFLPQARLDNKTEDLDKWVISHVLETQLHSQKNNQILFIHVDGSTLANLNLLSWLSTTLKKFRVSTDQLVIQISESVFYNNKTIALEFCAGLRELGIGLSITKINNSLDPLPLLTEAKPDFTRLDQNLVKDCAYSVHQQQRVKKLINAIHYQEILVGVTGVEEFEMLPLLCELGLDFVQGKALQAPDTEMKFSFPQEMTIML